MMDYINYGGNCRVISHAIGYANPLITSLHDIT